MLTRRRIGAAGAALLGELLLPRPARATTALALGLEDLVKKSGRIAVATPVRAQSGWETWGGGVRIVTRTTVLLHEVWRSDSSSDEEAEPDDQSLVLATLGGRAGDRAQKVHGEAVFAPGETFLVFAGPLERGSRRVVGMAQGHYPLVMGRSGSSAQALLRKSRDLPALVRRGSAVPAVDLLADRELDAARRLVRGIP